jgi:hypothetical protein
MGTGGFNEFAQSHARGRSAPDPYRDLTWEGYVDAGQVAIAAPWRLACCWVTAFFSASNQDRLLRPSAVLCWRGDISRVGVWLKLLHRDVACVTIKVAATS